MATNYGMLNNIASGVKEAMTAYQTNKTLQRQEQMQNLLQGARENPETGELEYTPEMKMKKEAEMRGLISDKNKSDPMSPESKQMQDWAKANGIANAENLSASQIEKLIPTVTTRMNNEAALARAGLLKKGHGAGAGDDGGKRITPTVVQDLSTANYVNDTVLNDLAKAGEENKHIIGPAEGLLGKASAMIGVGDRAAKQAELQSKINSSVQEIGKYLEGGKLAEGDMARYREMAPKATDQPRVFQAKLENLSRMVAQKQAAQLSALKGSGYDVGGINQSRAIVGQQNKVNPVSKESIQQSPGQTVKVFDPKGNVRIIPKDQLDAAIKAGGKLAE